MKTNDLNNPETAMDLPQDKRELIKQMQNDYKAFNEQQKLYEKLHGTVFDQPQSLHPNLLPFFKILRERATPETLGGIESYFSLMRIETFEGLSYHQMAMIFNYIEGCSVWQAKKGGIDETEFLDMFEFTYNVSAIKTWNPQKQIWVDEIAVEKQELMKKINTMVDELNKAHASASRKTRKKPDLKVTKK